MWKSRPVKGDVGIVFVPESEVFNFVQQGSRSTTRSRLAGRIRRFSIPIFRRILST